MRASPSLFVVIWRDKRSDEYWSQAYPGLDDVCTDYDERDRSNTEAVASAELFFTAAGPRWVAFNVARETTAWRKARADEAQAIEAETRDYREDLI